MISRKIEILVGFFVSLGLLALAMLVVNVANTGIGENDATYTLNAKFDNIGSLKVRAPIKVGGVVIGRVSKITLDKKDYLPVVEMKISDNYRNFSETTSVNILTAGILGEQYLEFKPGVLAHSDTGAGDELDELFDQEPLKVLTDGDFITDTKSALILEELIGQFLFSQGGE